MKRNSERYGNSCQHQMTVHSAEYLMFGNCMSRHVSINDVERKVQNPLVSSSLDTCRALTPAHFAAVCPDFG